ncbi:MAG: VOC family protein [Verrucomicrobiales bacterium]|nr:VOC family protein [Verrucomicrobiales bacterium]
MSDRPRIRYAHVNIIADDWRNLMNFYVEVFDCEPVSSERDHRGKHTDDLTGIEDIQVVGQHLRVPGHGENGPTIEIFTVNKALPNPAPAINRPGFAHIAFEVSDFEGVRKQILDWGGTDYGKQVTIDIPGAGRLTLIYMTDPEGNIVELQHWH